MKNVAKKTTKATTEAPKSETRIRLVVEDGFAAGLVISEVKKARRELLALYDAATAIADEEVFDSRRRLARATLRTKLDRVLEPLRDADLLAATILDAPSRIVRGR